MLNFHILPDKESLNIEKYISVILYSEKTQKREKYVPYHFDKIRTQPIKRSDEDDEEINSKRPCHQTNQIARAKPQKPPETSKITLTKRREMMMPCSKLVYYTSYYFYLP